MATSKTPTRKVGSGTLAGALVTIIVWILESSISGLEIPSAVVAAGTTLVGFGVAYLVPDKIATPPDDTEPSVTDGLGE